MKNLALITLSLIFIYGNIFAQTFTRLTNSVIVSDTAHSVSCSWGDYDNDGDLDLHVGNWDNQNCFFYRNLLIETGVDSFLKVTTGNIVKDSSGNGVWIDYDNDTDLDLFTNNLFRNLLAETGIDSFINRNIRDIFNEGDYFGGCSWGDYDNDGDLDFFISKGGYFSDQNNCLYRNMIKETGIDSFMYINTGDIVNDGGYSGGCNWVDYDNDGDLDLYVANSRGHNNFLYQNLLIETGIDSFVKINTGDIVNNGGDSSSDTWGDYDNDGDLDLFVANYGDNNFLYANNGDGTFTRIIVGEIVNDGGRSTYGNWGDFDNDGDLDLFVSNAENQKNFLYENNGDGTFLKLDTGQIVNDICDSFGNSWCDYDNDGDLDLFVANYEPNNFLYCNNGNSNNWINIKCIGIVSNTSAIGTRLWIKAILNDEAVWQMREVSGYNDLNVKFGLGNATVIDTLKIRWPSGIINIFTNILANQFITAIEDQDITGIDEESSNLPEKFKLYQNYPNPFNPSTIIKYKLPESSHIVLKIYNLTGQKVATLVNEFQTAGEHEITWQPEGLPSGLYFYKIQAGDFSEAKKLILQK